MLAVSDEKDVNAMKLLFAYLQELAREVFFLLLFLLGVGSTISTYIPLFKNNTILNRFGLACIFISFLGANFRLYRKLAARPSDQSSVLHLIDELEYDLHTLQDRKASTAPALRDEAWKLASGRISSIPDELRSQLNSAYMKIRSAKEIQESIQSVPLGANITPEQIQIEKLLDDAQQLMPIVVKRLRDIAGSGK